MIKFSFLCVFAVAMAIGVTKMPAWTPEHSAEVRPKVVAYVPNWIDLAKFSETIAYEKLTHLNVAFENPMDSTGELSFNADDATLIAKAHARQVRVSVSIGGGSASRDKEMLQRYFALLTAPNRARFIARIADYLDRHGFDGLDVDIEGPSINADYGAFVHDLAITLKPRGKLLTAALSQGYSGDKVPASVFDDLDFVNVMAYDGAGYWDPAAPGQPSSLSFTQDNVDYWLKRGLSKAKTVLGVPFYGYGFGTAFRRRDYPFREIVAAYPGAEKSDQVGSTIWYNGLETIRAKSRMVVDQGLAGVMIWSLDEDAPGKCSLLSAIDDTLKAGQQP